MYGGANDFIGTKQKARWNRFQGKRSDWKKTAQEQIVGSNGVMVFFFVSLSDGYVLMVCDKLFDTVYTLLSAQPSVKAGMQTLITFACCMLCDLFGMVWYSDDACITFPSLAICASVPSGCLKMFSLKTFCNIHHHTVI